MARSWVASLFMVVALGFMAGCSYQILVTETPGDCKAEHIAFHPGVGEPGHVRIAPGAYADRFCGWSGDPKPRERRQARRATYYGVARTLHKLGEHDLALEALRKDLQGARRPAARVRDYIALADMLDTLGWTEAARAALHSAADAARLKSDRRWALRSEVGLLEDHADYMEAIAVYDSVYALTRGHYQRWRVRRAQADLWADAGDLDTARRLYFANGGSYLRVARTYLDAGNPEAALDLATAWIELAEAGGYDPAYGTLQLRADALEALGRPLGAARALRKQRETERYPHTDHENLEFENTLGRLHRAAGRHELAYGNYVRAYNVAKTRGGWGRRSGLAAYNAGLEASRLGDASTARRWLLVAREHEVRGASRGLVATLVVLARNERKLGLEEDALVHLREAVALVDDMERTDEYWGLEAYEAAAMQLLRQGFCERGVLRLSQAIRLAQSSDGEDRVEEIRSRAGRARRDRCVEE